MKNNIIPLEDVFGAYYVCRRRKRNTCNALGYEINYREDLIKLWRELNEKQYRIGKSIAFIVTRPKLREVFAADFRDRIVHHIIMQRLEPLFEQDFIDDNYSCRVGRGTTYGVDRLYSKIKSFSNNYKTDCWIGKFDIKGFFMSINRNLLWLKLKKYIKDRYNGPDKEILLYLTKKVVLHRSQTNCIKKSGKYLWDQLPSNKSLFTCDPNCGLPIGNLTSQCFANFYMNEFDHLMSKLFKGQYGRYVDDFYVIARTKEEITSRVGLIRDYLKRELGLDLHPDKNYIQRYDKGVRFIGYSIRKNKIKLGNVCISGIYNAINKFNHLPPTVENAIKFANTLNSYMGFLGRYDSYKKRKKIWELLYPVKWRLSGILWIDKKYKKVTVNKGLLKRIKYEKTINDDFWMD